MTGRPTYDAVVVGAGPNGLAAAVELARNGCSVAVVEAESTIGGGARSAELTLPGYVHDLGSAIHPFGYASPFFRSLPRRPWAGVDSPSRAPHPPIRLRDSSDAGAFDGGYRGHPRTGRGSVPQDDGPPGRGREEDRGHAHRFA